MRYRTAILVMLIAAGRVHASNAAPVMYDENVDGDLPQFVQGLGYGQVPWFELEPGLNIVHGITVFNGPELLPADHDGFGVLTPQGYYVAPNSTTLTYSATLLGHTTAADHCGTWTGH